MIVEFDTSFEKSIDKLKDNSIIPKIEKFINSLERADSISQISNIKKLGGFKTYYRFRIGEYRIGFEKINNSAVRLIILAHRKEIYRIFP